MKLIIAGSRDLRVSTCMIWGALDAFEIDDDSLEIVCGECPTGADNAANQWSNDTGSDYMGFPADWEKHGRAAGPIRNRQMAEYGDVLLLIWDGKSKGSGNMKKEMEKLGKPVKEIIIKG